MRPVDKTSTRMSAAVDHSSRQEERQEGKLTVGSIAPHSFLLARNTYTIKLQIQTISPVRRYRERAVISGWRVVAVGPLRYVLERES